MGVRARVAIFAISVCSTVALIWGGVSAAMRFLQWGDAHPSAGKAMPLLPVFILSIGALLRVRRRERARSIEG